MEQFETMEQSIQGMLSIFLLGCGLVLSLTGLFLWLGGLRSIRILAGMSLAGLGFWGARLFGGAFPVLVAASVIPGVLGMFFKRAAGALLGTLTAGLLGMLVFVAPILADSNFWQTPVRNTQQSLQVPDAFGVLNEMQVYLKTVLDRLGELMRNLPSRAISSATICVITAGLLAVFRPLWVAALYTSSLGTALIAVGLTLLLIKKGAEPFSYVESHPKVLTLAAGGMVLFGVMVQASLFREKKKVKPTDVEKILLGDKK